MKKPRSRYIIRPDMPRLERMFKEIWNSARSAGKSVGAATRIAAATVNKYRAEHGLTIEEHGRRGWWPGKRTRRRR